MKKLLLIVALVSSGAVFAAHHPVADPVPWGAGTGLRPSGTIIVDRSLQGPGQIMPVGTFSRPSMPTGPMIGEGIPASYQTGRLGLATDTFSGRAPGQ